MPLNTIRLNHQKSSHPNERIVFIKPLPRPPTDQASYDLADTFLRAIAAQCLPIMKGHYLSVTTLEEYEPNPEFIGRNFNNGEIIQLVLRSKNGSWVPFNMVQMVMMHELAHNIHMNHGRDFWKTRNLYAEELKGLWAKGYTGEGFWGSGRTLDDMGSVMGNNVLSSGELENLPLCGGTFRSRTRKRKPRDRKELTWKEKRDRRIEKKFGKNGVALGEDEDQRLTLEINRKGPIGGKPRVAQSKRGRELRAAAALARFETNKQEVAGLQPQEEDTDDDDDDDYDDGDAGQDDATDLNGQKLLDSHGHSMIRVCDNEDMGGLDAQHEVRELGALDRYFKPFQEKTVPDVNDTRTDASELPEYAARGSNLRKSYTEAHSGRDPPKPDQPAISENGLPSLDVIKNARPSAVPATLESPSSAVPGVSIASTRTQSSPEDRPAIPSSIVCPICSLENPRLRATCMACAHVLDPRKDPRCWTCTSDVCRESGTAYLNAGDAGVCGICGARRNT